MKNINQTIYLLGAANPESIRMIDSIIKKDKNKTFVFLDNDKSKQNKPFFEYLVVGGTEDVSTIVKESGGIEVCFVNLITGCTKTRKRTTQEIVEAGGTLTNFIHPSIDLNMVKLGVGLYIQEAVVLQAGVSVGDNTSIHMGALIGHETTIDESVFIAHAASISGCCSIGEGSFIGTNATILPRITIGNWVTIGAGAVVTKNIPDCAVVIGNPGKVVKYNGRK